MSKESVFELVNKLVSKQHLLNLGNPNFVVVVDINKVCCCLSVVEKMRDFSEFKIRSLCPDHQDDDDEPRPKSSFSSSSSSAPPEVVAPVVIASVPQVKEDIKEDTVTENEAEKTVDQGEITETTEPSSSSSSDLVIS